MIIGQCNVNIVEWGKQSQDFPQLSIYVSPQSCVGEAGMGRTKVKAHMSCDVRKMVFGVSDQV